MNGWTEERRQRQSLRIHEWKPWKRSTGPQTPEGKAKSSRNAYKASASQELRQIAKHLRQMERVRKQWFTGG